MFAKLYETEVGQVLVKLDSSPEECVPEIRFYFMPPGLGVSSIAISFQDSEEGWDKAEIGFNNVDEEKALSLAKIAIDHLITREIN